MVNKFNIYSTTGLKVYPSSDSINDMVIDKEDYFHIEREIALWEDIHINIEKAPHNIPFGDIYWEQYKRPALDSISRVVADIDFSSGNTNYIERGRTYRVTGINVIVEDEQGESITLTEQEIQQYVE